MATMVADHRRRALRRRLTLVFAFEIVVRFAVATWGEAYFFVLFPPVIAVTILGAELSGITAQVDSGGWSRGIVDRLMNVGPRLAVVAVLGHAVALVAGTGLFLLIDTVARYVFYASGGTLGWEVVLAAPLVGVAHGTFIAWAPLADTVDRVANGNSVHEAGAATLGRALRDSRWLGGRLALHAAGGGFVVAALVVGVAVSGVALLVIPLFAAFVVAIALDAVYANQPTSSNTVDLSVPLGRLVVVVLVLVMLVSAVSAVRVTETRPTPTETTQLPEDPNAMYATALSNTAAGDYAVAISQSHTPQARWTIAVERSDREARITTHNLSVGLERYQSAGTSFNGRIPGTRWFVLSRGHGGESYAVPGYWTYRLWHGITGHWKLPHADTGQWHVRDRENGTVVLELTNESAVYRSFVGFARENATYETAWVRMRVDTDRGVVTSGELRLNATVRGDRVRIRRMYDVRTGSRVDVSRPAELDGRALGEWTWKLFAY